MTTPQESAGWPIETRSGGAEKSGRSLGALFRKTPTPAASDRGLNADLAALLDNEVMATQAAAASGAGRAGSSAATGKVPTQSPGAASNATATTTATATASQEPIDIPPYATEARPVGSTATATSTATAQTPPEQATPSTEPGLQLPVTKRFGAIIMDTSPASSPTGGAEGALVPQADVSKAVAPSGPGAEPAPQPLPAAIERTQDQKTIIIARLNDVFDKDWQKQLHHEIDDLYKQVAVEFSSPPANAEKAMTLLREARQILIEAPEDYVSAEYRKVQVQAMLNRMRESRKQSQHSGPRILGYELAWLFFLLLGFAFAGSLVTLIGNLSRLGQETIGDFLPIWNTMMWGGIGGVIGALYHLWWHISDQQDFDGQYLMWYLVQPIMGLGLGGIVFLLSAGGLLLLQMNPLGTDTVTPATRLLPYLVAVLAGFRQNFIYEQFDRLVALFTPGTQRSSEGSGRNSA